MAQAMAETVGYVNRARSFMPPGTVPAVRVCASTPESVAGRATWSSPAPPAPSVKSRTWHCFRVRPMFARPARRLRAAPVRRQPADRGSSRSILSACAPTDMNPGRRGQRPERGATRSARPATCRWKGKYPFVPVNTVVRQAADLETIPLRAGRKAPVYLPGRGLRPGRPPTSPPVTHW